MKDNYRDIPPEKIIDVPETPSFGKWRGLFDDGARKQKEGEVPSDWPLPTTNFEDVLVFRKPGW